MDLMDIGGGFSSKDLNPKTIEALKLT